MLRYICAAFILLTVTEAWPQPPSLNFEWISNRDGLPSNDIRYAAEDQDGFLWLATRRCLTRYDGYAFKNIGFTTTFSVAADKASILFTEPSRQLRAIDVKTFQVKDLVGEKEGGGNCVFVDSAGNYWFSDRDGINRYHPPTGTNRFYPLKQTSFKWHKGSVVETSTGEIWVLGMEVGLFKYDRQRDTLICKVGLDCPDPAFGPEGKFAQGAIDEHDVIWGASLSPSTGLFRYDTRNESMVHYLLPDRETVTAVLPGKIETNRDVIWIGTETRLGIFFPDEQQFYFFEEIMAEDFYVYYIFESPRTGIVWFCTNAGLMAFNPHHQAIQTHRLPATLPSSDLKVNVVQKDPNRPGIYWLGLSREGLLKWDRPNNSTQFFPYPHFPHRSETNWILRGNEDQLLIGVNQWQAWADGEASPADNRFEGVFCFDTQQEEFLPTPFQIHHSFFSVPFYSLGLKDHAGRLWLGNHYEGIQVIDLTTNRKVPVFSQEAHDQLMENGNWIMDLFEDSRQRIWLATYQGVFYFDETTGHFVQIDHPPDDKKEIYSNAFLKLTEDNRGNMWVAGWHILIKMDPDGKILGEWSEENGIYDWEIRKIGVDPKNHIWLGTFDGLHSFDEQQNTFNRLTVNDGLISNNTLSGFYFDDRKKLIVGHQGGWNTVDPDQLNYQERGANITISTIRVNGQEFPVDWNQPFQLKRSQNAIGFDFSALDFLKINDTRYAYLLEGVDKNWTVTSGTPQAYYTNLLPKNYHFRVTTLNSAGQRDPREASVLFSIRAAYYETIWFKTLGIILISGLVYGFYRYRINQLLQMQTIREKISQDLHDEVGTALTNIEILAHLSAKKGADQFSYHQKILEVARTSNEALHQIVWSLKPESERMEQIVLKLTRYAVETLEPLGISLYLQVPEDLKDLKMSAEQRRDLFLVFKEAINNICKHARADRVVISMEIHRRSFRLCLEDDGIGFDPAAVPKNNKNGMINMQNRLGKWHGRLEWRSEKNEGTRVEIQLPIP